MIGVHENMKILITVTQKQIIKAKYLQHIEKTRCSFLNTESL